MSWLPFNSPECWQITLTLLHVSWIGFLIGLISALANRFLQNSDANRRYWLNFASLLLFAASLPVTFAIVRSLTAEFPAAIAIVEAPAAELASLSRPDAEQSESFSPPTDAVDFAPATPQVPPSDMEIRATALTPPLVQATLSAWDRATSIGHTVAPFVAVLYAIGVALMFVKLAFGVRVSRRLRSSSTPISDTTILDRLTTQAKKLLLRITPVVACCEHTAVPIVVGLLRPMILIPAAMVNGLTIEQLESVLTHELAHLRRRDHLLIVVQRVLEAILFFHPVTWYLGHRLHDDREISCDDLVMFIGCDRLQYAQSLLRVAELRLASQSHQKHIALAADGQRPSKLRRRIAILLGDSSGDSVRVNSVWSMVTVLVFLLAGIVSLSSASRPASAVVQDDAELDHEGVLELASKAYENPASITTAHVRFRIAELDSGLKKGTTSEKCRQLLTESGVSSEPDKLEELLATLIMDQDKLEAKPWTSVNLYQDRSQIRTTTSTSTHGPDYWIGGQWSYRWDSAKSEVSLLRREDDRFHKDERLDEFLRNRRMTFADLKFQKPISIRKDGDKILLQYDRNSELQQETTLDAVSGRIHSVANFSHGVVFGERLQLGWRAFNDDIWLPSVIAEFYYRRGDLDHCRFIVIEDASFNQPLPDDVFRFGVPAGSVIADKRVGLNQSFTINRDVADVTSDEQLEAARAPLSGESAHIMKRHRDTSNPVDSETRLNPHGLVADLPGGGTIELIGFIAAAMVGGRPAEPDVWRPDGTRIPRPRLANDPLSPSGYGIYGRALSQGIGDTLLRVAGLRDGQTLARFKFRKQGGNGLLKRVKNELLVPTVDNFTPSDLVTLNGMPEGVATGNVDLIGITADWGPWQRVETNGTILERVRAPDEIAFAYSQVVNVTVQTDEKSPASRTNVHVHGIRPSLYLIFGANPDDHYISEIDCIAIDKSGKRHKHDGWSKIGDNSCEAFKLTLDQIDHFQFRLRPYLTWVQFYNVSLIPGKSSVPVVRVYDAKDYVLSANPGEQVRIEPVAVGNLQSGDATDTEDGPNISDDQSKQDPKINFRTLLNSDNSISIIGHVRDIHGKPVSGANVSHPVFANGELKSNRTQTDAEGRFELNVIGKDLTNYPDIWIWHEGYSLATPSLYQFIPVAVEQAKPEVILQPESLVRFRIETPDGRSLKNADVYPAEMRIPNGTDPVDGMQGLFSFLPNDELKDFATRTTDQNGVVELPHVPASVLSAVGVATEEFGIQEFDIRFLTGPRRLMLAPVGQLNGTAPPGTRIAIKSRWNGTPVTAEGRADVVADAHGNFQVKALAAGQVTITPHNSEPEWLMADQSTTLQPGTTLTIDIAPQATIPATGRLVHADSKLPIANARVSLQVGKSTRTRLGTVSTDTDGKFTARCIPGEQFVAQVIQLPDATMLYPKPTQLEVQVPEDAESFAIPDIEIKAASVWKGKLVDMKNNPVAGRYVQHYFDNKVINHPSRTDDNGDFGFAIDKDITPDRWTAVLKWDLGDKSGNAGYANDRFEVGATVISEDPLVLQIQEPEPPQADVKQP